MQKQWQNLKWLLMVRAALYCQPFPTCCCKRCGHYSLATKPTKPAGASKPLWNGTEAEDGWRRGEDQSVWEVDGFWQTWPPFCPRHNPWVCLAHSLGEINIQVHMGTRGPSGHSSLGEQDKKTWVSEMLDKLACENSQINFWGLQGIVLMWAFQGTLRGSSWLKLDYEELPQWANFSHTFPTCIFRKWVK